MTRNITVNGNEYSFVTTFNSTRSGFNHECRLYINNSIESYAKCNYINRTWESYPYRTVMQKAIHCMVDSEKNISKDLFKTEHKYQKMTAKREEEFENYLATSDNARFYREYKEVYEKL